MKKNKQQAANLLLVINSIRMAKLLHLLILQTCEPAILLKTKTNTPQKVVAVNTNTTLNCPAYINLICLLTIP